MNLWWIVHDWFSDIFRVSWCTNRHTNNASCQVAKWLKIWWLVYKSWDYYLFCSKALESSLLLGVNDFDFSAVIEDPCSSSSKSMVLKVKITACGSGQFTCDDGQCVNMDERCNQISNCRYIHISWTSVFAWLKIWYTLKFSSFPHRWNSWYVGEESYLEIFENQ